MMPLHGLRVIDVSTIIAGPLCCQILGDFGADVIKVEHPNAGDSMRGHGAQKDGVPLWWKQISRNKRTVGLSLSVPEGAAVFRRLAQTADVIVENFRPGTLERWGLAPQVLREGHPGLVIVRLTGFGQSGPYAARPGFGTLAEAMSGFAHLTGEAAAAHLAGLRASRQHLRDGRLRGGAHRAVVPGRPRRPGSGHRYQHPGADHDRGRPRPDGL